MKKLFIGAGLVFISYLVLSWGYYLFFPEARAKRDEKNRIEKFQDSIAENQKAINEKAEDAKKELQKHESMAKVIAKDFVSKKLNFPEEADFELLSTTVQYNDSALYNVRGYVTAKNAFGVKSKKSYNCFLHYLGGEDADTKSWELVALTIE